MAIQMINKTFIGKVEPIGEETRVTFFFQERTRAIEIAKLLADEGYRVCVEISAKSVSDTKVVVWLYTASSDNGRIDTPPGFDSDRGHRT